MRNWGSLSFCSLEPLLPKADVGARINESSPGVDGQNGLRLQFNSRQSSTVDTSIPFSAQHFEYSTGYSAYIPCRQTATCLADSRLRGLLPKVDVGTHINESNESVRGSSVGYVRAERAAAAEAAGGGDGEWYQPSRRRTEHERTKYNPTEYEPSEHESSEHVPTHVPTAYEPSEHMPSEYKPSEHRLTEHKPSEHEPSEAEPSERMPTQ
eukprot:1191866-Prorocentrum_minimum.AAC.2